MVNGTGFTCGHSTLIFMAVGLQVSSLFEYGQPAASTNMVIHSGVQTEAWAYMGGVLAVLYGTYIKLLIHTCDV